MIKTLREDKAKGVRLEQHGNTYFVHTYRPATGEPLSVRTFIGAPVTARRYYNRALTAARDAKHLDQSNLRRNPRRFGA